MNYLNFALITVQLRYQSSFHYYLIVIYFQKMMFYSYEDWQNFFVKILKINQDNKLILSIHKKLRLILITNFLWRLLFIGGR